MAHIVDVAFDADIDVDSEVLAPGGSIAAYATGNPRPDFPFWELLFKNARLLLLGSDDFPVAQKVEAARAADELLASGWNGLVIDEFFELDRIVDAHEHAERKRGPGRVLLDIVTTS